MSGGAILGDGRIGLILDAAGIIKLATKNGDRRRLPRPTSTNQDEELAEIAEAAVGE